VGGRRGRPCARVAGPRRGPRARAPRRARAAPRARRAAARAAARRGPPLTTQGAGPLLRRPLLVLILVLRLRLPQLGVRAGVAGGGEVRDRGAPQLHRACAAPRGQRRRPEAEGRARLEVATASPTPNETSLNQKRGRAQINWADHARARPLPPPAAPCMKLRGALALGLKRQPLARGPSAAAARRAPAGTALLARAAGRGNAPARASAAADASRASSSMSSSGARAGAEWGPIGGPPARLRAAMRGPPLGRAAPAAAAACAAASLISRRPDLAIIMTPPLSTPHLAPRGLLQTWTAARRAAS
jgi:hypothetical protein